MYGSKIGDVFCIILNGFYVHGITVRVVGLLILQPRYLHVLGPGDIDGCVVAGVRMSRDANPWVRSEDTLQTLCSHSCAVCDNDHACVEAVADAHSAAVVEAHPARASCSV